MTRIQKGGIAMEAYVNKYSKESFIHIREIGPYKMLLLTPKGEIKSLESSLFYGPFEGDENSLIERGVITRQQSAAYKTYIEDRKEERKENWELIIEELKPWELDIFIGSLERELAKRREKQGGLNET